MPAGRENHCPPKPSGIAQLMEQQKVWRTSIRGAMTPRTRSVEILTSTVGIQHLYPPSPTAKAPSASTGSSGMDGNGPQPCSRHSLAFSPSLSIVVIRLIFLTENIT